LWQSRNLLRSPLSIVVSWLGCQVGCQSEFI
jgi:hypothetical protein